MGKEGTDEVGPVFQPYTQEDQMRNERLKEEVV